VKIVLIVEGRTEEVFLSALRRFLSKRLTGKPPQIEANRQDGLIPRGDRLRRIVEMHLNDGANYVIAVSDVNPNFISAADAKEKMRLWVGGEPRFHPHAAQHDFEAWLLPYWDEIKKITGCSRNAPLGNPELVNHHSPPSEKLREAFRTGANTKNRRSYVKTRDAKRILDGKDLIVAAKQCRELRALLDTILTLCGASPIS
jgi:hypothetical protein